MVEDQSIDRIARLQPDPDGENSQQHGRRGGEDRELTRPWQGR